MKSQILAINAGSSSVKAATFTFSDSPQCVWSGSLNLIGNDTKESIRLILSWLNGIVDLNEVAAIGHRTVHGGNSFCEPVLVKRGILAQLKQLEVLDPDHAPLELGLVRRIQIDHSTIPQILCFDTEFHASMPRVATQLPIPRHYEELGVRRFGFHGLSYSFLLDELSRLGESEGRIVLCHLGSGCSLAAVRDCKCLDTTMGFTPSSGVMMSTRSGDLDPGVLTYLNRTLGMRPVEFHEMVNKRSGLLGVSDSSGDIQALLRAESSDSRASEAVALFCYQIKKAIGSFAAVLGGLDTLVFSGGIGVHAAEIRARVSSGLEFLGVNLDIAQNLAGAAVISATGSAVTVRVMQTNEELVIARAIVRMGEVLKSDESTDPR